MVAKTTGDYRVEIRSLEKTAAAGRYEIKLAELRAATLHEKMDDFAARLAATKTDEESAALLAAERELVTPVLAQYVYKQGGDLLRTRKNFQQVLFIFKLALKLAERFNDKKAFLVAYHGLGTVYEHLKKFDLALEYHLKSVALLEQMNEKENLGYAYQSVGNVYRFKGEYARWA